tara:strand:- start:16171 stop:17037 length:867 start_codon:yes stop_codon:yes gene_type:complete
MNKISIQDISSKGEWEIQPTEIHVERKIGGGTFGTVFKGVWRGTEIAIKVIKNDVDTTEFDIEMDIISRLHHPNILQFLGACTIIHPPMIIMEYMSNDTLEASNKQLTHTQRICVIKDIAKGLAYLHNRKPECIIHRDLKPNNILLTTSFKAKIADFGISCIRQTSDEDYDMTSETGTYRYMAPEVLMHKEYNAKVDIWSFGMIILFMFSHLPYEGLSTGQIIHSIINYQNVFYDSGMCDRVKHVFRNCALFNPSERWDSLKLVQHCNTIPDFLPIKHTSLFRKCFCL